MNDCKFLKMIFDGYVNYYGALRWHSICSYADMTQLELSFFADLGAKLGFIVKREHTENPPDNRYNSSNPRDLVWIECANNCTDEKWNQNNTIFLHLERENETQTDTITGNNKLFDSARYNDDRFLVGIFGFLTTYDFNKIKEAIEKEPYKNDGTYRNILIIAWVGENKESVVNVYGLVYSGDEHWERLALADWDKEKYWYLYYGQDNIWEKL